MSCKHWQAWCKQHRQQRWLHRWRKRLFLSIYLVVIASVIIVSLLAAGIFHLRGQGIHVPIFALLAVAAMIVSLGAYPISRRLTYRLEQLKSSVEALGAGKLDTRMPENGCDEVAVLAHSFNQSAERIQALLVSHRQLLANASHELRSPLARMQMGLAMLAEQKGLENAPQLQAIRQDMRELNQLVEEILLASRLDTPEIPLEKQTVDLAALLAEECVRVEGDCEAQPLQLQGDERLLRRLIRNLLENARRHGGGEVSANLIQIASMARLQVMDRGKGIPNTEQSRVFEPFYRPAGHGEGQGGWGLGLSLVRQIATRHGGQVSCQSREGGGTVFMVSLPLNK